MNIGSICTRDVVTVDQDMSLQEVAQNMRDKHVGSVVVIGNSLQGTSVLGVVTDRDLALQILDPHAKRHKRHYRQLMQRSARRHPPGCVHIRCCIGDGKRRRASLAGHRRSKGARGARLTR